MQGGYEDRLYDLGSYRSALAPEAKPQIQPPRLYHYLRRFNADMRLRGSFSRLKKKVKHLGNKLKLGRPGAGVDAESAGPADSLPGQGLHVIADGGGGNGVDPGGQQVCSTDHPSQQDESEPVPAGVSEDDRGGGGADVEGREGVQSYSHPHLDIEVVVGGGPGQGGDGQFYSSLSTPPALLGGEPNGA